MEADDFIKIKSRKIHGMMPFFFGFCGGVRTFLVGADVYSLVLTVIPSRRTPFLGAMVIFWR
ncbi:hypothetical protein [Microbulbifer halophilus]|uniref:hypothetical protein n=1 Tax=Microbulbifer halophilus TaxID=453963 RepID=UPI00360BFDE6